MRLKANKMGYSLNQRGLFSGIVRDPKDSRVKLNEGLRQMFYTSLLVDSAVE